MVHGGGRSAAASRWAPGAPTRRPRSRLRGRPTSRASPSPPTSRPAAGTASPRPAPPRTPGPCCTRRRPTPSAAQVDALGAGHHAAGRHLRHRTRASARPSRSPAPAWARSGSTPATWACSPTRPASSSTSSAPRAPGSCCPVTSTSTPSPRSRRRRSTPTASAPRSSPARERRPPASSTSWSRSRAGRSRNAPRTRSTHGGRKTAVRRHRLDRHGHRGGRPGTGRPGHACGRPGACRFRSYGAGKCSTDPR